jgi:hypothetical protein
MAGKAKSALRGFDRKKRGDRAMSELSPDEAPMSDFSEDADGRFSPERAARLLASSVIRTAELQWTVEHVRVRLREAARGCERLVRRVGPDVMRSFWPDPALFATEVEFSDQVTALQVGAKKARPGGAPLAHMGAGGDREISRIEEAIYWPMRYLGAPEYDSVRAALRLWIECEARNWSFSREYLTLDCSRAAANRRVDAAMRVILEGVIRDGVRP